jgi:hypothetical protein
MKPKPITDAQFEALTNYQKADWLAADDDLPAAQVYALLAIADALRSIAASVHPEQH